MDNSKSLKFINELADYFNSLPRVAKKTAQLHKWFPEDDAPELQIGFVVIQFKLGE